MREQLLAQMEAARTDTSAVVPPTDFQYQALEVTPVSFQSRSGAE